jgi:hypothetical protein
VDGDDSAQLVASGWCVMSYGPHIAIWLVVGAIFIALAQHILRRLP